MLRLRYPSGETVVVDANPTVFLEICDQHGDVAQLIYQDAGGVIHQVTAEDEEAENYGRLFGVHFVKIKPA